jgi:hypothetical protein
MVFEILKHEITHNEVDSFNAVVDYKMTDNFGESFLGKAVVFSKWDLKLMKKSDGIYVNKIYLENDAVVFEQDTLQDDLGFETIEQFKACLINYFQQNLRK